MKSVRCLFVWLLLPLSVFAREKFEFRDGDVVAFIGGTFMEREQEDANIELMLTRHAMDKKVTFRDLGWSGDQISSHLKGSSAPEPRQKYVPDLFANVAKVKPTVIFISYGMMESFNGQQALPQFIKDYETVLDKLSATTTRIILVSPIRHEALGGAWPNPTKHNEDLRAYTAAIKQLAEKRGFWFVDLFDGTKGSNLTSNGVHLNGKGYVAAANAIEKQLALGRAAKMDRNTEEQLRSAIKTKNKQFWYFYRPMNAEYVYTGGTRFQDKLGPVQHPMNIELDQFYALALKHDDSVDAMKREIAAGKKFEAQPSPIKGESAGTTRPVQRDPSQPDPAEERAAFKVADGLNVELFASDPLIAKPIQIAFDARGRLWVATTTRYPQIKPGETQDDKIIILEDKNGDGKADTATIFADNLLIPTGILPSGTGCYTSDDTKIWFLKDPNHLGRATDPEIVLSGFGTEDSHHKAHVFRWGPNGDIYFNQGVFLHSVIETAYGIRHLAGNWNPGIWEYDPASGELEIYLANSVPPNPWGHYWNYWGFDFHIDSSGQGGSYMILPTAGRTSSAVDIKGGEGKLAGAEIISGDHVPPDWQGTLISNPFKENRVHHWAFREEGAGYSLKQLEPIIVSTNNSFRPVDIKMGPDGAIYIADWYNPLIGHMQYHFRDPGRDFTHGRIWRITFKDRPLAKRPQFRTVAETLEHLKDSADYNRMQARRVLAESNPKEVLPALGKWVKQLDPADPKYDHNRLEALWVYQSLKSVQPELLKSVLQANEPNARAAATIVLRYWRDKMSDTVELLAKGVTDEHPRVRLQAVIALSYINEPRAVELATKVLDKPMDAFLDRALRNAVQALKPTWQPALEQGSLTFDGDLKRLQFVLEQADSNTAAKTLLALLRAGKISQRDAEKSVDVITSTGGEKELGAIFEQDFNSNLQAKVLADISRNVRERNISLSLPSVRLKELCTSRGPDVRAEALRLAGTIKSQKLQPEMIKAAAAKSSNDRVRAAALEALVALGGADNLQKVREFAEGDNMAVKVPAILALSTKDMTNAVVAAVKTLQSPAAEQYVARLIDGFLQKKNGSAVLAQNLSNATISQDVARLGLRAVQSAGRQDADLVKVLSRSAGWNEEIKPLTADEMAQMVSEVRASGDPARGELIFHRHEVSCMQCHAINGIGGNVGPDLSAVGTGSTVDYLIDSVLFPNKIIKDGFETVEVTTKDDDYILGIKVRENSQQLVLKDATHPEIYIAKANIAKRQNRKVSVMPSGLANTLTHAEFIDLIRFLSELGKPGPYANNTAPVARRWQIAAPVQPDLTPTSASGLKWSPAYSQVSGLLPLSEVPKTPALARCEVEVISPGKLQLQLNSTEGLKLWIDNQTQPVDASTQLDLGAGTHAFTFLIDGNRREGLRAEFDETPVSPARFHIK